MYPPDSIAVCFAVEEEARPFRRLSHGCCRLQVRLTGMGRMNVDHTVPPLLDECSPGLVLSCGFAGGLNPEWPSGSVLFTTDRGSAIESALVSAGAQPGRFYCAERVATTAAEKERLWQETSADAVEMESGRIAALCRERNIPCATVRVVLDAANEDLPLDFNALMTPDLRLDARKLALAVARAPGRIPALLRLRRQSESAAAQLAGVLAKALELTA